MKCVECGMEFDDSIKTCPNCGCPVQDVFAAEKTPTETANISIEKKKNSLKTIRINLMAVVALILGIAIMVMGFSVKDKTFDMDVYNAAKFGVDSAKFGADFYTEIYKASDVAVDAISAVNGGLASISESIVDFSNVIMYSAGMIIIAIGMGVSAVAVIHIKKEV